MAKLYAYTYDVETGGILLNDSTPLFSKEPRPVYAQELDILGINSKWRYQNQNEIPYMWAEAGTYYYRGAIIFRVKGGSLCERPEVIVNMQETREGGKEKSIPVVPLGTTLLPMDMESMLKKNRDLLSAVEQVTLKKIYHYYKRYKNKNIDCFHVAFSGGKDSIVLLDLVKRALPRTEFKVLFGDTGMEFPDTYKVVDIIEKQCKEEGIEFKRAKSHFRPEDSWRIFGPPSKVLRWCCSVHKAAPQTLKIRDLLQKNDYVGVDFVGVRAFESLTRSEYDFENFGKKQKGQYSHNSILDWSSAEIWLYIYTHKLPINEAYKKGNARAGCLLCPMGGGKSDFFRQASYPREIAVYTDLIRETIDDKNIESYISNGGWAMRKNGRDIAGNKSHYQEETVGKELWITITDPATDWREWMKTIDALPFLYTVEQTADGYIFKIPSWADKSTEVKRFKQVLHKAAYCTGCRVCEVNCRNGCISFENGLHIEGCVQCGQCHAIDDGCLLYHSLQLPKNGGHVMRSINTFADHAPKYEWLENFFTYKDSFFKENSLGPMQISMFKRFLSDASLASKNTCTEFAEKISGIGWETQEAWGLILIQLAYNNPQIKWYIDNMPIEEVLPRAYVETKLTGEGISEKDAKSIVKAFGRLCKLPLGTKLHFGSVMEQKRQIAFLCRHKTTLADARVVLYALYRFAEACGNYYQFTLSRLLDDTIESAGISPVKIFGLDRDDMTPILQGLSAKYEDFIDATFTHDLDKITLREDKSAADVLKLF